MNTLASFLETGYRVLALWFMLAFYPTTAVTPGLGDGYWHTRGNQILDSGNRPVRIAGINWYGFETTSGVPGGLDVQDYKSILTTIRKNGYNTIRIPLSNQMVETPIVPTELKFSNRSGPINTDLKGLNSLQILDRIVSYAGAQGLKVILDNHRSVAGDGPEMSGLWYTQAFPESAWISDWLMLAQRYAGNPTVIGFDIRNEPHNANSGGACWGCGGAIDWRLAAERAGNAVLHSNPRLLIFVEGVDTYDGDYYWWGGNLEGVRTAPVRLAVPNQLVYSAHDYGPIESGQPWFTPQMTESSLADVWTKHWGYISQQGIAPVWLGEFGYVSPSSNNPTPVDAMESLWFRGIIRYLSENPFLHWTYWSLNSADRYGLLNSNYDATPRDSALQDALTRIQFPLGIAVKADRIALSPHDSPRQPDTVVVVVPPSDANHLQCHVDYTNIKDWQQGFTGGITIHNTGNAAIEGWKLTWTFAGNQKIGQLWSGNYAQTGRAVTLTNLSWNSSIPPGGEVSGIGFNATYTGQNPPPTKFYLNGSLCK